MKKTAYKIGILINILAIFLVSSCVHDDFDEPEAQDIPTGNVLTIGDLRQMYADSVQSGAYPEGYKFSDNFSVYCVCTMDDKSGNIYKSAYVQDATGAINLHLLSSGGIYEGDSIRLYLKGLILDDYENMLQLDSVHVDDNMVKIATEQDVTPEEVEIGQIQTGNYQGQLVKLTDVQFVEEDLGKTFADAENLITENRTIEDCDGQELMVRTSGYADFASYRIPEGKGSMIAIVGQFRDDWQLYIRSFHELDMEGLRCGEYDTVFSENFNGTTDGEILSLSGWNNIATAGTLSWKSKETGEKGLSAIIDGRAANEDNIRNWLISPAVQLTGGDHAMSFDTRAAFDKGGILKAMISTDYDSGNPEDATWTDLNANVSDAPAGGYANDWTSSGEIDLSSYSGEVYISFVYEGTDTETALYLLDDIMVFKN
ncbi:MAG: DUF5689 domain-containing protein [Bacteroidales bacterium]